MLRKLAAGAMALVVSLSVQAGAPVNINTADAATLANSLDGVGPAKASAIVAWREANGPFKSADDLAQIKGIGQDTLERNRAHIQLSEAKASAPAPAAKAAPPPTPKPASTPAAK